MVRLGLVALVPKIIGKIKLVFCAKSMPMCSVSWLFLTVTCSCLFWCREDSKVSHYIINRIQVAGKNVFRIGDQEFSDVHQLLLFYKTHYLDSTPLRKPVSVIKQHIYVAELIVHCSTHSTRTTGSETRSANTCRMFHPSVPCCLSFSSDNLALMQV